MGVSKNRGKPPKMDGFMENPIKMHDLQGVLPHISASAPEVHPAVEALIIRYALDAQCAQQLRQLPLQLQVWRCTSVGSQSTDPLVNDHIAGWKMGAPDGVDVFPIENGDYSSQLC